jgi:hypothetical protein
MASFKIARTPTARSAGYRDRVGDVLRPRAGHGSADGRPEPLGYQFVGKVERALDDAAADSIGLRVVPGVSSLQVAARRARTPMDATFVTLHKSGDLGDDLARLRRDAGERHLLVLPRPFDWDARRRRPRPPQRRL